MKPADQIRTFLDDANPEHRTLLVCGRWGVGKTTLVNGVLEEFTDKDNLAKAASSELPATKIMLSLFGVSDVKELNAMLVREFHPKMKKVARAMRELNLTLRGDFYGSVLFSPAGIFDLLAARESKRIKRRYFVVIDDIERRDNRLRLEEVFGFVDQIKYKNVKVILIANTEQMSGDVQFAGFKDKVIQKECYIQSREEELKRSLFGLEGDYFDKLSVDEIDNLRTVQKLERLIRESHLQCNVKPLIVLQAAKYALECIDNGKYNIDDLQKEYRLVSHISGPPTHEQVEEHFHSLYDGKSQKDIFVAFFKGKNPFSCLQKQDVFLSKVYDLVSVGAYDLLDKVEMHFSSSPYPEFEIDLDPYGAKAHDASFFLETLDQIKAAMVSKEEYSLPSLFISLCKFEFRFSKGSSFSDAVQSELNKLFSYVIPRMAEEALKADYDFLGYLEDFRFYGSSVVPTNCRERRSVFFESAQNLLLRQMSSFDFWALNQDAHKVETFLQRTEFDPAKRTSELVDCLKGAVESLFVYFDNPGMGPNMVGADHLFNFAAKHDGPDHPLRDFINESLGKCDKPYKEYLIRSFDDSSKRQALS